MKERWAVKYPKSGIHECPFGKKQAETIWFLALQNGVEGAVVVVDRGHGWQEV